MSIKNIIKKNRSIYHILASAIGFYRGLMGILKGRKGSRGYALSTISFLLRSRSILGLPVNITVEPTNICNLKCSVCETGAGILKRPKRNMSLDEFRMIADKIAPFTNTLMLYFMGEPFLNSNIYEMIRYVKDKGIPFVTVCTNGDVVNPEKLIDSGIDEINFQICGLTKDVHEMYRVGSNLDVVMDNLKKTIEARNRHRAKTRIVCGFILMKQNEHQVKDFDSIMKRMGVDEAIVIDPCVRTLEQGRRYLPSDKKHWLYDPEALSRGELKPASVLKRTCPWLYYSAAIQVNGDVVPCCRDVDGDLVMGNIFKQDFGSIWNGTKFMDFRKDINDGKGKAAICRLCSGYGPANLKK